MFLSTEQVRLSVYRSPFSIPSYIEHSRSIYYYYYKFFLALLFFAASNVSSCPCFYSAKLKLLQLALFSFAFAVVTDEHKFMPPPHVLALLDIFPTEASVQPSTSPQRLHLLPQSFELWSTSLDIRSCRILFYDLSAGPYHPQRPFLHTLRPFLMLFANLLERTCPLISFWQPHLIESCLRQPFVLATRWRLVVVLFPPHAQGERMIGQMLAQDTGSADADITHASLVGINAFVLRLLSSVLSVEGGGEGKSQSTNSSVTLL